MTYLFVNLCRTTWFTQCGRRYLILAPGEDVFTITLRAFLNLADLIGEANATGYPDMVKIDTDGDDLKVLAGFPFDTYKPALFSVEWDEAGEVVKKLDAEGYRITYAIYKPVNRWKRAIFSRYSLTPDFRGGECGDVVGVRPEHFEKFKNQVL